MINHIFLLLINSNNAFAEVSDKCPAFVSQWVESEAAWSFLSLNEALIRLTIFTLIYFGIAVILFFFIKKNKKNWPKFLPLAQIILVSIYLILEFISTSIQNSPCSISNLLQEMPKELQFIQLGFYAILLIIPTALLVKVRSSGRNQ